MKTSLKQRLERLEVIAQPPLSDKPALPSEIWLSAPGDSDAVLLWERTHESH